MDHSHKVDGRPSIQWYWDDWMTDWPLRRCSAFDRGIWMDMLALMWSAPRRGFLETKSGKIGHSALAKISGESEADIKQSLSRLEAEHVFSKDDEGTIYCRRMARDEKQRVSKAEAGRIGGKISRKKAKGGPSTPTPSSTPTPTSKKEEKTCSIPPELVGFELYEKDEKFCSRFPKMLPIWKETYPHLDVMQIIKEAHLWEMANPARRKKDRVKFLTNWLSRADEDRAKRPQTETEKPQRTEAQKKIDRDFDNRVFGNEPIL